MNLMGGMDMKRVLSGAAIGSFVLSVAVAVALLVSPLGVQLAKADNLYASIRGRVLDQTGAVVPDVKIRATNVGTGIAYPAESGKDGSYAFQQLPIGDYKVTGEKQGFRTYVASNIHLDLNQVFQLDMNLEVGTVSQEVMVEANQVQVETSSPQLGAVIDANQIVNMPLLGRNWINLQQLQPGVVAVSDGRGNYATNGSESQQNSFLIDGTDTNDLPLNTPLIIPSPDAISEFRMVTATINPEYGRNSGAVLNAAIKSGTNSFHGDAFEFYRDPFLNTRNFFSLVPAVFHQNTFGATIGGPVWKKHTFFFFSYQGNRRRQPQAGGSTNVFDAAQLSPTNLTTGATFSPTDPNDLSGLSTSTALSPFALTGSDGKAYPAGTAYSTIFGCNGGKTAGCTVGFIPSSDINPIAAKLIQKYVPAPNAGTGSNLFEFNPTVTGKNDQYVGKIDQNFGSDSIWGSFLLAHAPAVQTLPFTGATLPGFSETDDVHDKFITVAWQHVINSRMVNELRGGYTRLNFKAVNPTTPALPSSAGFDINPQLTAGAGLPVVNITGLFSLGFSANGPQPRIDQTYEAVDNFSLTQGRHSMKFGFDMRRFQVFNPFSSQNDGVYSFGGSGIYSTSDPGADFLLGVPDTYGQTSGGLVDARSREYYSYAQDQYKLRPNLTITYGVGWQIDTPIQDLAYNGHAMFAFRPNQQSVIFPNAPVGFVYQGDPGVHASGLTKPFHNFGPRIGFAYSPGWGGWLTGGAGKTSVRGGYGIYYNRSEEEQTLQFLGAPPFTVATSGAPNPSFANPFQDIKTGVTVPNNFPFAGATSNAVFTAANGNLPLYPFTSGIDPNSVDPMSENFNLTIERQLPGQAILSLGYVGAVAHHLTASTPINIVTNNKPCLADPACGPFNQDVLHPEDFAYNPNIYGTIDNIATRGNSRYNSLQASYNKRLSHGLQLLASYTYSHSIDDTSGFENGAFGGGGFGGFGSLRGNNPYNLAADYGNSIFDAKQRFVLSYFYQIPSARHFSSMSWMPSRITDGWTISGITTFQTGFPLDVVDSSLNSLLCTQPEFQDFACPDHPNIAGPVTYSDPRTTATHIWFSKSAFSKQVAGTLGDAGRNILRGPGLNNFDFQLYKDTRITETTRFEMRIEFYNIMNHTQFDPSGITTDIHSSRFGRERLAHDPRLIQLAAKFYF
jgi:hypothetical protein